MAPPRKYPVGEPRKRGGTAEYGKAVKHVIFTLPEHGKDTFKLFCEEKRLTQQAACATAIDMLFRSYGWPELGVRSIKDEPAL